MPWPNRVNPFGEFEAVAERGLLMGNRGCLLNRRREIVKPFELERWISCVLEFKGRRRQVMMPGLYTELFFLDEATALAAGHRPCAECRRTAAYRFLSLWNEANGQQIKRLPDLDRALHIERLRQDHPVTLANGVIVAEVRRPLLHWDGHFYPWTPAGYQAGSPVTGPLRQLTPPSIARTLAVGYGPLVHPSRNSIFTPLSSN